MYLTRSFRNIEFNLGNARRDGFGFEHFKLHGGRIFYFMLWPERVGLYLAWWRIR